MNKNILLSISLLLHSFTDWHHNLEDAKQIAKKENKYILLNFSGSDWCGPCVRMKKEMFDSKVFKDMASSDLVLVNADFPRKKKNQLTAEQKKINDELAEKYNGQGIFPYTLLLDSDGKIIKTWNGFPEETPYSFNMEVSNSIQQDR